MTVHANTPKRSAALATGLPQISPPTNRAQVGGIILVLVITYFCFFHGLTAFGLVGPDEPRYAAIARDMAITSDWITPRLHGEPWLEKPILYYWSAAIGYRLLGDSELAARLPSAVGALTTLLALGWLTRRFYGSHTALLFGLVFPSSIAGLAFSRAATPDMLFSSSLAVTLAVAMPLILVPRLKHIISYQIGFGVALGLAVMAKGPAGVVLAGASCTLGALLTRHSSYIWRLTSPPAIVGFGIIALPWYVACGLQNPEFVQVFFLSHNIDRFLTPVFSHTQPFWFFIPVMLLALAPWTAALAHTVCNTANLLSCEKRTGSPSVFLVAWALFPVAFFSLSQSKLPGYVLPAVPACTALLSHAMAKVIRSNTYTRTFGIGLGATLAAMTLTFLAAPEVASSGVQQGAVRPLAVVLGFCALATTYLGYRRRLPAAIATTALGIAFTLWQLNETVLPKLDPMISSRATAQAVLELSTDSPIRTYALHRAWQHGLEYYLSGTILEWNPEDPDGTLVITTRQGMRQMQLEGAGLVMLRTVSNNALLVRTDPSANWQQQ